MDERRDADATPLVSVCIPTVDRLDYVGETIESVVSQRLSGIEIVVSDNSADPEYQRGIDAIVARFPDAPIRVHHQPARLRMVDNANFLVDAARGKYWMYLPDDDRLLPECLETLVAALDGAPRSSIAFCDHWIIDSQGRRDARASNDTSERFGRTALRSGEIEHERLMSVVLHQSIAIQCLLMRADVIRRHRFDARHEPVLDFDLELRLAADPAVNAVYCGSRLVEYRVHGGQTTAGVADTRVVGALTAALERCVPVGEDARRLRRRMLTRYRGSLAARLALTGDHRGAMRVAMRAIRADPLSGAWKALLAAVLPHRVVAITRALTRLRAAPRAPRTL